MYFQIVLFFQTWNILQHFERTVRGVLTGALEKFVSIRITLSKKRRTRKRREHSPALVSFGKNRVTRKSAERHFYNPLLIKKHPISSQIHSSESHTQPPYQSNSWNYLECSFACSKHNKNTKHKSTNNNTSPHLIAKDDNPKQRYNGVPRY